MNRHAIASLVLLSGLLAATYATARPIRNVHAISEYGSSAPEADVTSREDGAAIVARIVPARRVVVAKGAAKVWVCGPEVASLVGGTYRACEWEVVR